MRLPYTVVKRKGKPATYFHRIIAEKALGHALPPKAEVHHRKGFSDVNTNLIICQDRAYHRLLETRQDAYRSTKDANKRRCIYCKQYDSINQMQAKYGLRKFDKQPMFYHKKCRAAYEYDRRHKGDTN